jgi:mRNA-degrading endonuclease RelE of RelBE toxin-antitoxin system
VTWDVLWEPAALDVAVGHLKESPVGVEILLEAARQLADNPRPAESTPWGSDYRRLRQGNWRILYRIDESAHSVHIEHVGRSGT